MRAEGLLVAPLRARLAAGALLLAMPAAAQPTGFDWPCVQAKVPTLTPAVVWAGPPFEEGLDWEMDVEVASLVERLSQRRVPEEEALAEIGAFAAGADAGRLTLLFAGLFERMNAERSDVVAGIERYARRQISEADRIRAQASALERRRGEAGAEEIAAAEDDLAWAIRVFDDRRDALGYACEVPRLIEQRLFALGRAIAAAVE